MHPHHRAIAFALLVGLTFFALAGGAVYLDNGNAVSAAGRSTDVNPIDAPDKVDLTDDPMVEVTATFEAKSYGWNVSPARRLILQGKKAYFACGTKPRDYLVIVSGADGDKTIGPFWRIVPAVLPGPPDPPDPPKPPTPTTDAEKIALEAANKLPATGRQADARILAEVYRQIAAQVGVAIKTPEQLIAATRLARSLALTPDRNKVWDAWSTEVGAWIDQQRAAGKLATINDLKTCWEQIATGLGKVQ